MLTWQNSWQKCKEASSGDCELSFRSVVKPWNRSRSSSIAFRVSYSFSVSPSAIFTTITTAYAQMLRCHTRTRTHMGLGGSGGIFSVISAHLLCTHPSCQQSTYDTKSHSAHRLDVTCLLISSNPSLTGFLDEDRQRCCKQA